jgi:hypothetical protein
MFELLSDKDLTLALQSYQLMQRETRHRFMPLVYDCVQKGARLMGRVLSLDMFLEWFRRV